MSTTLLSVSGTARCLEISRTQVYRLVEFGILHREAVGDKFMITVDSIQEFKIALDKKREANESMKNRVKK